MTEKNMFPLESNVKIQQIDEDETTSKSVDEIDKIDEIDESSCDHIDDIQEPKFYGSFQMLPNYVMAQSSDMRVDEKSIVNILEDIRVSLDCLAEAVLKVNRTLEKHLVNEKTQ